MPPQENANVTVPAALEGSKGRSLWMSHCLWPHLLQSTSGLPLSSCAPSAFLNFYSPSEMGLLISDSPQVPRHFLSSYTPLLCALVWELLQGADSWKCMLAQSLMQVRGSQSARVSCPFGRLLPSMERTASDGSSPYSVSFTMPSNLPSCLPRTNYRKEQEVPHNTTKA